MKRKNVAFWVTRTGLMLALALIAQAIRLVIPAVPTLVVGSLVNTTLIVATGMVGLSSALVIAIVTPVVALLQGFLPHVLMVPGVMVGQIVLVVIYYYMSKLAYGEKLVPYGLNRWCAMITAAIAKFTSLYFLVIKWLLPLVITAKTTELSDKLVAEQVATQTQKIYATISAAFTWPQLINALIGGALALIILAILEKAVPKRE